MKTIDRLGVTVSREHRRSKKRNPEWSRDLPPKKRGKWEPPGQWGGHMSKERPPNRKAESRPGQVTLDEAHGSGRDSSASGNK